MTVGLAAICSAGVVLVILIFVLKGDGSEESAEEDKPKKEDV